VFTDGEVSETGDSCSQLMDSSPSLFTCSTSTESVQDEEDPVIDHVST